MANNLLPLISAVLYVIPATIWAYARLTVARATLARAQAEAAVIRRMPPAALDQSQGDAISAKVRTILLITIS
jgi:hypothetical protein